jgi:hypothetical protein
MCTARDLPKCESNFWRKARKEHACDGCKEAGRIKANDKYHVISGIWDGQPHRFKHCARCWNLLQEIIHEGAEAVDLTLDCGMSWEEAFGSLPDSVAALAFQLPRDEGP